MLLCAAPSSPVLCWHRLPYWQRRWHASRPRRCCRATACWCFPICASSPENGEFGGQRITLQRFAEVDTVLYEYTAGGLSWPVVASEVVIDPRGRQFYFTVQPPDEEERTIRGTLSDDGKTLVLDGSYCNDPKVPMKLARVSDFGRAAGTCRVCPAPKNPPPAEAEPAQPQPQPQPSLPPQPLQKIEAGRTTASL
jgi:hypothetical protein